MIHPITTDRLVESAIKVVSEDLLRDFDNMLRSFCDGENNRKTVLRYVRIRLHVLCESVPKEDTPENLTRIRFLHIVIGYIDTELDILNHYGDMKIASNRRWTGATVELIELIYALHEMKRIDDGETAMNELAGFLGGIFGMQIDAQSLYNTYMDIKRRKGESRTYFLDKLRERLNLRMQRDDAKEKARR